MTTLEGIEKIESALTSLELKSVYGEKLTGLMAVSPVARFNGTDWDKNEDALDKGEITIEQYTYRGLEMIELFKQNVFLIAAEKRILS